MTSREWINNFKASIVKEDFFSLEKNLKEMEFQFTKQEIDEVLHLFKEAYLLSSTHKQLLKNKMEKIDKNRKMIRNSMVQSLNYKFNQRG